MNDADRIAKLEARVAELEAFVSSLRRVFVGNAEEIADDEELDGKFGDPVIRKDPTPRYWKGEPFRGRHLSQTTPEYLEAFAKYKDTCAKLNEQGGDETKKKYASYDRRDAARARGWARRLREGWSPSAQAAAPTLPGVKPFIGRNPFAGAAPPAPPSSGRLAEMPDDEFPFGANARDLDEDGPL